MVFIKIKVVNEKITNAIYNLFFGFFTQYSVLIHKIAFSGILKP